MARNDIVISTYQTVSSELSEKRLVVLNSAGSVDDDDDDDNDSDTKSPMLKKSKNRRAEKRVVNAFLIALFMSCAFCLTV